MPAEWEPWIVYAIVVAALVVVTIILTALIALPLRYLARRNGWDPRLIGRMRRPFRVLLLTIGLLITVAVLPLPEAWQEFQEPISHGLRIAIIASAAWLLVGVVSFFFARTLDRYPLDVADNRMARRVHTQVTILRRLASVLIVVLALGAILLTFEGVQAIGASVFASAGVLSVVAGIAAQSTLGNVFAGLQIAFTDAIRVDDVVVVEGEWGRIEDITLTYVVVKIWDQRRLVLPSTYFVNRPFENWTRNGADITGTVELDLDWRISPAEMRAHYEKYVDAHPLFDGRARGLQITDAVGGLVKARFLMTAEDSGKLWDLRCDVREAMVEWVHATTLGVPRTRVELLESGTQP